MNFLTFEFACIVCFAILAGYSFRNEVSYRINKSNLKLTITSDNLFVKIFTDIFVVISPLIVLFIMLFNISLWTKIWVSGFVFGVLISAFYSLFRYKDFIGNRNGHIAVWDDSPERFMHECIDGKKI